MCSTLYISQYAFYHHGGRGVAVISCWNLNVIFQSKGHREWLLHSRLQWLRPKQWLSWLVQTTCVSCSETSAVQSESVSQAQEVGTGESTACWQVLGGLQPPSTAQAPENRSLRNVVKVNLFLLAIVESLYDGGYQWVKGGDWLSRGRTGWEKKKPEQKWWA